MKIALCAIAFCLQACSAVDFDSPASTLEEDQGCNGASCITESDETFQVHRIYGLDLGMITNPLDLKTQTINLQIPAGEDSILLFIHSFQSTHWVLKGETDRVRGVFLTSNSGLWGEFYEIDIKVFVNSAATELNEIYIARANPVKRTLGDAVRAHLTPAKQEEWLKGAVAEVFPVDLGLNSCYLYEYDSYVDTVFEEILKDNSANCADIIPSFPL